MNLYLRYFDHETLVSNADEAVDFLRSLQEIKVTPELVEDIRGQLLEQEAGLLVRSLRQAGLEKEAAFALLDRLWEESKEEGS